MIYLTNAISIGMFVDAVPVSLEIEEISVERVKAVLSKTRFESAVGHQGTADVLTKILDIEVKFERKQISATSGDLLIVFQLLERLPEGAVLSKEEVEDLVNRGKAKFYLVRVI